MIAFSRNRLYELKQRIERTGRKCCVVYGGLPPQTRREQASLFNDPTSGYDVMVASDAVGMGLNLNIRRIIFTELSKFDGTQVRDLLPPEVRQIAGRAGRFGTEHPDGIATVLAGGGAGGGGGGASGARADAALLARLYHRPVEQVAAIGFL